ncbi:MAG: hypothetical protein H0U65_02710 [Rubrobacter sp.]|nr:hypothetical protein [Rubrobacter sp.]
MSIRGAKQDPSEEAIVWEEDIARLDYVREVREVRATAYSRRRPEHRAARHVQAASVLSERPRPGLRA